MLKLTATKVVKIKIYAIEGAKQTLRDSIELGATFRPSLVEVVHRDDEVQTMTFTGPRLVITDDGVTESKAAGVRVFTRDEMFGPEPEDFAAAHELTIVGEMFQALLRTEFDIIATTD